MNKRAIQKAYMHKIAVDALTPPPLKESTVKPDMLPPVEPSTLDPSKHLGEEGDANNINTTVAFNKGANITYPSTATEKIAPRGNNVNTVAPVAWGNLGTSTPGLDKEEDYIAPKLSRNKIAALAAAGAISGMGKPAMKKPGFMNPIPADIGSSSGTQKKAIAKGKYTGIDTSGGKSVAKALDNGTNTTHGVATSSPNSSVI